MRALAALLLVLVLRCSNGMSVNDVDKENKKIVNAVCYVDTVAQYVELNFFVSFNGNPVDRVLALTEDYYQNSDGTVNEAACATSNISNGNVEFTSRASLSGNSDLNRCGARRIDNTNNFLWVVEVRAVFSLGVYVEIDRRYFVRCIYNDAFSKFAVAQLNVFGEDRTATSEKLSPVNSMSVLAQQPGGAYTASDIVNLDQMVKIRISSIVTSTESTLDPYGVFPFSCDFGPLDKSQRTKFTLSNGCPNTTSPFGLTRGFRFVEFLSSTLANSRIFTTETESFVMATAYPPNNFYYLSCYVDYCFGSSGSDTRCTDFCLSNGRKRRQEETIGYDSITIALRVNGPETTTAHVTTVKLPAEGDTTRRSTEDDLSSDLALIIGSSVASVVFLVILLAVVFMLCCRKGCCNGGADDRLWDSSSSTTAQSSKRNLVMYGQGPPTLIQPKA